MTGVIRTSSYGRNGPGGGERHGQERLRIPFSACGAHRGGSHRGHPALEVPLTVTGSGEAIGDYLVTHPGINMITFTGSSQVGKSLQMRSFQR